MENKYVVCINNKNYEASLEPRKIYEIIPNKKTEAEQLIRIIDESGEDYLYPIEYFVAIELEQSIKMKIMEAV